MAGRAQDQAGAQLWRLAAITLPTPAALATGGPAAFWNPAQEVAADLQAGLDVIQAPAEIAASGLLATIHVRVRSVGHVGVLYGRMEMSDLVRTTASPEPEPGSIAFFAHTLGLTWTRALAGTALGVTLAAHENRLDAQDSRRWTADVGVARQIGPRLRVAAATHFLSPTGEAEARDDDVSRSDHPPAARSIDPSCARLDCGRDRGRARDLYSNGAGSPRRPPPQARREALP